MRAEVALDRGRALVTALGERLSEARERRVQAERKRRYDEAKRRSAAVRQELPGSYAEVVRLTYRLLHWLGTAQLAVQAGNDALPAGAEPLVDSEMITRGLPPRPQADMKVTTQDVWCHVRRPDRQGAR